MPLRLPPFCSTITTTSRQPTTVCLRRIIRDYKYRGVSAQDTIHRWPSVRAGENKWIFPFQENADAMLNTAMLYELAVLKMQAEPLLEQVPENCDEYAEAYRLLKFLKYFKGIPFNNLPPTSLLREFLGGKFVPLLKRFINVRTCTLPTVMASLAHNYDNFAHSRGKSCRSRWADTNKAFRNNYFPFGNIYL